MNSTMFTTGPTQPLETIFNISDYVNFDFDFDAPYASVDAPSDTLLAQPLQSIGILDPYIGYPNAVDTDYAGISLLPSHSNSLTNNVYATQASSEHPAKTDVLQSEFGINASQDEFAIFEPMTVAQGRYSAVPQAPLMSIQLSSHVSADPTLPSHPQIVQEPSIWLPVSPKLKQHLNTVYASEISRQLDTANPAPVLYFPAEGPYACPTSNIQSLPDNTPRPELDTTSISPSVLMHKGTALSSQGLVQNGMHSPIFPAADQTIPDMEYLDLTKRRALDTSKYDNEPATKRNKTAQAEQLVSVAIDVDSDSDGKPFIIEKKIAQQRSVPITTNVDNFDRESENKPESESENNHDRSGVSDNSDASWAPSSPILPSSPVMRAGIPAQPISKQPARQGSKWRYERAQEVRLREQRRRKWHQERTKALRAKGMAPDRKMQKLLKEIEDSEGFAEAHDYGIEGRVEGEEGRGSVRKRPERKGARKSYAGQE